jgi:drug/metabolite transporter (DMT)-like permease
VLGLAIVAAVVAYVAGVAAARVLGARLASFLGLTEVLFAVAFAWLLLGQRLTAAQFAGAVLVLAGVALVRLDEPAPVVDPPITVLRREAQAARAPSPGRACEPACRATP